MLVKTMMIGQIKKMSEEDCKIKCENCIGYGMCVSEQKIIKKEEEK
jgi:hypothetical protein